MTTFPTGAALPAPIQASATPEPAGLAGWAIDLMQTLGAPGAGLAIALENLFPPLPSEVILPLAGFTASLGSFTLGEVLFWTTLGSVVGAILLYAVGRMLGRDRMRSIVRVVPLVDVVDFDRTEAWFVRHGRKAVFFGRMIPLFRSLISIPAGVTRMHPLAFILLTTAGSVIWNAVFIGAGYLLGENWALVEPWADGLQLVVVVAAIIAFAAFILKRVRRIRGHRASRRRGDEPEFGM